jgi:hypothetical protein
VAISNGTGMTDRKGGVANPEGWLDFARWHMMLLMRRIKEDEQEGPQSDTEHNLGYMELYY